MPHRAADNAAMLGDFDVTVIAAGTNQATATVCPADHVQVVSGTGGVILQEASYGTIKSVANNSTTVSIAVYPWSAAGFNGQTVNNGLNLPPGHAAMFICQTPTKITAIYG